jgi:hypothetical protein
MDIYIFLHVRRYIQIQYVLEGYKKLGTMFTSEKGNWY